MKMQTRKTFPRKTRKTATRIMPFRAKGINPETEINPDNGPKG